LRRTLQYAFAQLQFPVVASTLKWIMALPLARAIYAVNDVHPTGTGMLLV
jgi:hypothetical protein